MNEKKASESESRVLNILLSSEKSLSAKEISAILSDEGFDWANRTISTFLNRLEEKGLASHSKNGITHYYFPLVEKEEYQKKTAEKFLNTHFKGSVSSFLSAFVGEDGISDKELQQIKKWMKKIDDK